MKKPYVIAIISFILTTGCFDFDIVHYIEPKKDKSLFIKFRLTSIYFKDQTNTNAFNEDVIKSNLPYDKNSKISYQFIQNDLTAGVEITIVAKPHPTISNSIKLPIIPYQDKYGQYVLLFHNYENFNSSNDPYDSQKIAEGLLAASKYRLAFGNSVPKKALIIVNRKYLEKFNLSIYQIGNIYCIDIPMNLLIMNQSAVIVSCTNTINDSEISNYLTKLLEKRKAEEKKYQEQLNKQKNYNNDNDQYNFQLDNDQNTNTDTDINTDDEEE